MKGKAASSTFQAKKFGFLEGWTGTISKSTRNLSCDTDTGEAKEQFPPQKGQHL